ncbi:MAG: restriction modification system DNA specificity domain-containing protein [Chloroflexota bacterium]|nr:MAG: restriction modification system DNA specificity domain-containing protein [Chloroflexota bacterium]
MSHYRPYPQYKDSGVEWVGAVPSHWESRRMASLFREVARLGDPALPILSISIHDGITDDELAPDDRDRRISQIEDRTKYKRVAPKDLAYNMMRAWQGAFGAVTVDGLVSPAYVVAEPIDAFRTVFIEQLLRTPNAIEEMRRYSRGIADFRMRLYWDYFRDLKICLPSLEEQDSILNRVSYETARMDSLIAKKSEFIDLLEKKLQALVKRAVTKGLDRKARMRESGVPWIGEMPDHWKLSKLGYEVSECGGKTPTTDNTAYWGGDIPWVTPKDMKGDVIADSIDKITPFAVSECGMVAIPVGSVLVVVRGMILAHSFPVALTTIPVTINQDMKALVPSKHLLSTYLKLVLQSAKSYVVTILVAEAAHGTRVLRTDMWRQLPVLLPPIEEQQLICDHVDAIATRFGNLISLTKASIELLQRRRAAFMAAAVTGQIDLRESA